MSQPTTPTPDSLLAEHATLLTETTNLNNLIKRLIPYQARLAEVEARKAAIKSQLAMLLGTPGPVTPAELQFAALPKQPITFTNDAGSVGGVMAVIGRNKMDVIAASGAVIQAEAQDFIVRRTDLVISGDVVTPIKGNTVTIVSNGRTEVFQLMIPTFDRHDHAGTFIRLHGKLISST